MRFSQKMEYHLAACTNVKTNKCKAFLNAGNLFSEDIMALKESKTCIAHLIQKEVNWTSGGTE